MPPHALEVALRVARAAGKAALARFRRPGLKVDRKPDGSPVSDADRAADAVVRRGILRAFPRHGIVSEEAAETRGDGRHRWICDPLDGTLSFVRGAEHWAVLLALEVAGRLEVGVMHAPAAGTTLWAQRGRGAFENGKRIHVSRRGWEDAWIVHGQAGRIFRKRRGRAFHRIAARARVLSGTFSTLVYAAVARGQIEAFVEAGSEVWDRAAPYLIVREAGGRCANWRGEETHEGPGAIASNGRVYADLVGWVRGAVSPGNSGIALPLLK